MSATWMVNQGPSFNLTRPGSSYNQLTGFTQRFMLSQDSSLLTPGKAEPHQLAETMKGTFKLRGKKKGLKKKPERCKNLVMPKESLAAEPIYGGFGKGKVNKAKKKVVKSKPKKRRYRVKK